MITHIIWDFNGTVLDDVDASVAAVNDMLRIRGLPETTKEKYVGSVSLPLDRYYSGIGIKNTDMSSLSEEFRRHCKKHDDLTHIFEDFYDAAEYAKSLGIKNILMSSLYIDYLYEETEKYKIREYFDDMIGMDDMLVGSKLENAKKFIERSNATPDNILFIGDMINDAQIARTLGSHCILIPNGHNSKSRCLAQEVTVVESLGYVKEYLK